MDELSAPLLASEDGFDCLVVVQSLACPQPPHLYALDPAQAAAAASAGTRLAHIVSGAGCGGLQFQGFLEQQCCAHTNFTGTVNDTGRETHSYKSASVPKDKIVIDTEAYEILQGKPETGVACATPGGPWWPIPLRQWRSHAPFMWLWLMCSLLMVLMGGWVEAPRPQLVATLLAAATGVLGVLLHFLSGILAASGAFSEAKQFEVTAVCATAAACIDLLAMCMYIACIWAAINTPSFQPHQSSSLGTPGFVSLLLSACCCWQHGIASVAVLTTVGALRQRDYSLISNAP